MDYEFESFKHELAACVRDYLPAEFKNSEISFASITKAGLGELTAMTFKREDSSISPVVYINNLYSDCRDYNLPINVVAEKVGEILLSSLSDTRKMEQNGFIQAITNGGMDYRKALPDVRLHVMQYTGNEAVLKDVPHMVQGDIAAYCAIDLKTDIRGSISAKVTDKMLEAMGVTFTQLTDIAVKNAMEKNPIHIVAIETMIEQMSDREPASDHRSDFHSELAALPGEDELFMLEMPMLTVTNADTLQGAAVLFMPEVMDAIASKYPGGFYILPSSIHEVLILPKATGAADLPELNAMVRNVNQEHVAPEDRLSDHVLEYDPQSRSIYIAGGEKPSLDASKNSPEKEEKKSRTSSR